MQTGKESFFQEPLSASLYFWICSLSVMGAIGEATLVFFRFGSRLTFPSKMWIGLSLCALASLWVRSTRDHSKMRQAIQEREANTEDDDAISRSALRTAALSTFYGLVGASFAVAAALIALSKALSGAPF
jgi:hypothetical protein